MPRTAPGPTILVAHGSGVPAGAGARRMQDGAAVELVPASDAPRRLRRRDAVRNVVAALTR